MSNILFLMMGGIGTRFGSDIPKQFTVVEGVPIFRYIVDAYDSVDFIDEIMIICNHKWIDYANKLLSNRTGDKSLTVIPGGQSRSSSIRNGLLKLKGRCSDNDYILIHDSTHPYLDVSAVRKALVFMSKYDGVSICQKEYDTCYFVNDVSVKSEIPKKEIVSGASPEIFRYGDLLRIYESKTEFELESMSSAGAMAINNGLSLGVVPTTLLNIKITNPEDLVLFKELCSTYYFPR